MLEAHREAGDPNMDLMQLLCAYRLALAGRNDKGEMTEAETQIAMEKLGARLSQETQRRAAQQRAEAPQQAADPQQQNKARTPAYGALFKGLGTSGKPIVCTPVRGPNGVAVSFTCQ
jgi:membrane protease subunit (stomatin/prohibitin family)